MGANNEAIGRFYCIPVELTADADDTDTEVAQIGPFPFRWLALCGVWGDDGDWSVRIADDATDLPFSPNYIPVEALLGSTEREPYDIPTPYTFGGGSAIGIEAKNDGTGTDTLKLVFVGERLPPEKPE